MSVMQDTFVAYLVFLMDNQYHVYIEFIDSTDLNYIMFARNSGFKSRQHEVVFGVILVPQNNTIMCKHNII